MGERVAYVQVALPPAARAGGRRPRAEGDGTATVGLYPGMPPAELARLLRLALRLPPAASFSAFCVRDKAPVAGKKQRRRGGDPGTPRIVPLSLACRAPELLRGVSGRWSLLDPGQEPSRY
jgi:hypothetical protein